MSHFPFLPYTLCACFFLGDVPTVVGAACRSKNHGPEVMSISITPTLPLNVVFISMMATVIPVDMDDALPPLGE